MESKLDLSLPEKKKEAKVSMKLVIFLLVCLLVVTTAHIGIFLYEKYASSNGTGAGKPSAEKIKELALKLEKNGLNESAAEIWMEYLSLSNMGAEEQARIWYRIGKLYQQGGKHELALKSFFRLESLAKLPDLENDINLRVQELLETMGKFSALKYELADRVGLSNGQKKDGEAILAEIGTHKISKSEFDQYIEELIDRQLLLIASFLPEEQRKAKKEELLKHFTNPQERFRILNQLVFEEILYRYARENKLTEDSKIRKLLHDTEREILAQQVLQREVTDNVFITESDLKNYYESHLKKFEIPEQVQVRHILTADQDTADSAIAQLKAGADFSEIVQQYSQDKATLDKNGLIEAWVSEDEEIPGIKGSREIMALLFNATEGEVLDNAFQTDKGFHVIQLASRKPKRQKSFEESQTEIYQLFRQQKEEEIRQVFLNNLKNQYNVVIHASLFREKASESNQEDGKGNSSVQGN